MLAGNWFLKRRFRSQGAIRQQPLTKGRRRKQAAAGRALRVEELEDRRMLATLVVNNLFDTDGGDAPIIGGLRQVLDFANSTEETDNIVFADFLFTDAETGVSSSQSIVLDGGQLTITEPVNILGPGASALTIDAGGNNRIFETNIREADEAYPVTIGGVTLAGGNLPGANRGGAIRNREALILIESVLAGNFAATGGGAVFQDFGSLLVDRSYIGPMDPTIVATYPFVWSGNQSGGGGGAILNEQASEDGFSSVIVRNSTIAGNSTFDIEDFPGYGGGVFNRVGSLTIEHSTISENDATAGGGGVATRGVSNPEDGTPVVTGLSHSILFGNTVGLDADDVFAVRRDVELAPLAPTLNLDVDGGFNFIGQIGGAVLRGDPNDPANPDNPADPGKRHFYEVVPAIPDGIDWNTANLFGDFGPDNTSHLASISANTPDMAEFTAENEFVFSVVDFPEFWKEFEPDAPEEPPPPQNIGPWIGGIQVDLSLGVDLGWEWVTTDVMAMPDPIDPFDFEAWADGQPDDGELITEPADPPPTDLPEEDRIAFFTPDSTTRAATWGDLLAEPAAEQIPLAYVLEYDQGNNFFGLDPRLQPLGDYGGSAPGYYPTSDSFGGIPSPAIDAGGTIPFDLFDGRGRHFTRFAGDSVDIGAIEVQAGQFVVDALDDESDGQYSPVFRTVTQGYAVVPGIDVFGNPLFPNSPPYDNTGNVIPFIFTPTGQQVTNFAYSGDFSLREAIEFADKNPEFDTISFFDSLLPALDDPTASGPPTILLGLRSEASSALVLSTSLDIIGPVGYELEVDARGNDPTPSISNSDGSRIFIVDDGNDTFERTISVSNLSLLGGDVSGSGGAILNFENFTLGNSNVTENFASNSGGAFANQLGELIIQGSAVFDNTTGFEGGGLYVGEGLFGGVPTTTVRNSTLSGNSATRGGGILNANGELLVEFSTITQNNSAGTRGAGIANLNSADTFTQINSSIISDNFGFDVEFLQGATPNVQSMGFNLIGNGNALSVFNQPGDLPGVLDPKLAPLAVEGGFTKTHRVMVGSPAIDAGESTAEAGVGNVPLNDQRGNPFTRVFDGLQDTKDRLDIGAYELQGVVFVVDTPIDENDGIISAGSLSLREAVELSNVNPLTDVIMFNPITLGEQTIFQSSKNSPALLPGTPTDIRITDSVSIVGLGELLLTLDGSFAFTDSNVVVLPGEDVQRSRFFTIDDGDNANDLDVHISGINFTNSFDVTDVGASIKSSEDLTLQAVTFISNSTLGAGFDGGAVYQSNGSLILDDASFTANTTDGVDADGGAVFVLDADLTVLNSIITGNSTTQTLGSGGGIYIRGGTLDMTYGVVSGNLAPGGEADGGGIFGFESVLNLTNSYVTGNEMTGSNSEGAGLFAKDSDVTLTSSVVSLNKTTGTQSEGAGIYLNGGTAMIERSIISQNSTTGQLANGGGIAVVGGQLTLFESTADRNTASGVNASGGGIHNLGGDVTILNSTISNSSASGTGGVGGGIYSSTNLGSGSEKTLILNSTISGNSTQLRGGGVFNSTGLTEIRHSTLTNNSTPFFGSGGGLASIANAGTTSTRVYSSIVAGNITTSAPGNPNNDVDLLLGVGQDSIVSQGYNIVGSGLQVALNAFDQPGDRTGINDPGLGLLFFNGGFATTHALSPDSAAVNTGDPGAMAGVGGVPLNDQRGVGFTRQFPGTRIDVGAFESAFAPAFAADFDSDGDVDGADFLSWQRGFGTLAALKTDGDANDDSNVNSVDLGMWKSSFGTGVGSGALAAISTGESREPLAAAAQSAGVSAAELALSSSSEPLIVSAVLEASSQRVGLNSQLVGLTLDSTLESIRGSVGRRSEYVAANQNAGQDRAGTDAKDRSFATFSTQSNFATSDAGEAALGDGEPTDGAGELELTVEEQFFARLGA